MNTQLYRYGRDLAVASHGFVQRLYMLAVLPMVGLSQGFLANCGFNQGAGNAKRISTLLECTLKAGVLVSAALILIMLQLAEPMASLFTQDSVLISQATWGLSCAVLLLPLVIVQLICAVYFQACGDAIHSMALTLVRQGGVHLPLILLLPQFWGLKGVWYAYPAANLIGCFIALLLVYPRWSKLFAVQGYSRLTRQPLLARSD